MAHNNNSGSNLIEKIVRERIFQSLFWKEKCFGLNAESILDFAVRLQYVSGCYGANQQASPFLCLFLKLCQLQPSAAVIMAYLDQTDFKYLTFLVLFYLRLSAPPAIVYTILEPYLADRRRLRVRLTSGRYTIVHMDVLVDALLREESLFTLILNPRLPKRSFLEDTETFLPEADVDLIENGKDSNKEKSNPFSAGWRKIFPHLHGAFLEERPHLGLSLEEGEDVQGEEKMSDSECLESSNLYQDHYESDPLNQMNFQDSSLPSIADYRDQKFPSKSGQEPIIRESVSVEESHRIRVSLGLKPLSL